MQLYEILKNQTAPNKTEDQIRMDKLEARIKILEDDKDRAAKLFKATNKRYGIK